MDVEKYIASGILELYVAGLLDEEQNMEIHRYAEEYPDIRREILAIESAILELSKSAAPEATGASDFKDIIRRIGIKEEKARLLSRRKYSRPWFGYIGWAAALALAVGLWWVLQQNKSLQFEMQLQTNEIQVLEDQIFEARTSLDKAQDLLTSLRDKEMTIIPLAGQSAAPEAYAKVYWHKNEQKVLIDAQGLPNPPPGMVYQVWSLKQSPLTPTSLGLLEDFEMDENKVFALSNPNESEAFGITLEPAGGSETPTMEQLYTLGTVAS
jgi:anti-sigma-K factor RskA